MPALEILFALCAVLTIVLELVTGVALMGWVGDRIVVDRRKNPGPYWITMSLQILITIGLPLLIWFEYS